MHIKRDELTTTNKNNKRTIMQNWVVVCFVILCLIGAIQGQTTSTTNPNDPRFILNITLDVELYDVRTINDKTITFEAGIDVIYAYPNPPSSSVPVVPAFSPNMDVDDLPWHPNVVYQNLVSIKNSHTREVQVLPDSIAVRHNFRGDFAEKFDLEEFPFDKQQLHIRLQAGRDDLVNLRFQVSPQQSDVLANAEKFHLNGWDFIDGDIVTDVTIEEGTGLDQAVAVIWIDVERISQTFVTQQIVPSIIMVMVSWCGFWVDVKNAIARVMPILIATQSQIILISFAGKTTVRTDQTSFLEAFGLTALFVIFIVLVELLIVDNCVRHGRRGMAKVLDRMSRKVFPIVYGLLVAFLFIFFLASQTGGIIFIVLTMFFAFLFFVAEYKFLHRETAKEVE
mmetsp:Transcript_22357/g.33300  ORF Transcript_22357/g.33300 Transcript_22357/m.33300 type:complete len:395 (-) Transcript_22357:31-1215(-)